MIEFLLFAIVVVLILGFWGLTPFLWVGGILLCILAIYLFVLLMRLLEKGAQGIEKGLEPLERIFQSNKKHTLFVGGLATATFGLIFLAIFITLIWALLR